tara:strand:- start:460 stop:1401 length:942 start_codon:yes stop_codon:yes gene_type:complete
MNWLAKHCIPLAVICYCSIPQAKQLENFETPDQHPHGANTLNKAMFVSELQQWAAENEMALDENFNLDRRFKVESCPSHYHFLLSQHGRSLIKAFCKENGWERHLKLKPALKTLKEKTRVRSLAWLLKEAVAKGERITPENLIEQIVDPRMVPKNSLSKPLRIHDQEYYAKTSLYSGRIILESDLYTPVMGLVAVTTIPRGTTIHSSMVSLKTITTGQNSNIFKSISDLQYLETNKPIHAGAAILSSDMRKTKLVKRGDLVLVSASGKGFEIQSKIQSLRDGYLGDQITLKSSADNAPVRATVIGKSLANAIK